MAVLEAREEGLSLVSGSLVIRGDFSRMLRRIREPDLHGELLVRAACGRKKAVRTAASADGHANAQADDSLGLAIDATAGLGDDSLLLAAAGFRVVMFERDPIIAALLRDAMERAAGMPELTDIVSRMKLVEGDSIEALKAIAEGPYTTLTAFPSEEIEIAERPSVILLDPMFPERTKSSLVKKKLQLIQELERPCEDEEELLEAALAAHPCKVIIKRPAKGPHLAGHKPSYSISGKSIRYDCIVTNK